MSLRLYPLIVTASITCLSMCYHMTNVHAQSGNVELLDADAHRFYRRLIDGLAAGNRRQVAELFRYPLQVRVLGLNSRLVAVKDASAMLQMYPLFLGPQFRSAIEQRPVVGDGVLSMAGGRVIAQRTNGVFRITRLTVALEPPTRSSPPIRIVLLPGVKKQLGGRLVHDGVDTYVVSAKAGQRLSVTLERFRGRALAIRVSNQRTNQLVEGAATEHARVWNARVPEDGSYVVEIHRRLPFCGPDVTYLLTVALQ